MVRERTPASDTPVRQVRYCHASKSQKCLFLKNRGAIVSSQIHAHLTIYPQDISDVIPNTIATALSNLHTLVTGATYLFCRLSKIFRVTRSVYGILQHAHLAKRLTSWPTAVTKAPWRMYFSSQAKPKPSATSPWKPWRAGWRWSCMTTLPPRCLSPRARRAS